MARLFLVLLLLAAVAVAVKMTFFGDGRGDPSPVPVAPDVPAAANGSRAAPPFDPIPAPPADPPPADVQRSATTAGDHTTEGVLSVSGTVTDARNGQAIPDCEVAIVYPDGDSMESVMTGPDGAYRIEIHDGIPAVFAMKAISDVHAVGFRDGIDVGAQRSIEVDFALQAMLTVRGRVTDVDGQPIEGAEVNIRSRDPLFEDDFNYGETGPDGVYEVAEIFDLPREGLDVVCESIDHLPAVKLDLSVPAEQSQLTVDFVLRESFTLKGTVVSAATQQPLADASVSIVSGDVDYEEEGEDEMTDEDGTFELEIDYIPIEGAFVLVAASDHSPVAFASLPSPDRNGDVQLGRIALAPGVVLEGYVVNASNGAPVLDGDVYAFTRGVPSGEQGDYVDFEVIENGRFELALENADPANLEVVIESEGSVAVRKSLRIPPGQVRHQERFELTPLLVVEGTVTRTADGKPVPGALVRLLKAGGDAKDEIPRERVRPDGRYRVEIPFGDAAAYSVVIEYLGDRYPRGPLGAPPQGTFTLRKDFSIEAEPFPRSGATVPNRPMPRPFDRDEDDDD